MNILIDIRYLESSNTGIAVGLKSILDELLKYKISRIFLLCNNENVFRKYMPYYQLLKIKYKLFSLGEHVEIYKILKKFDIDIFYSHHFISPMIKPKKVKVINVIHDLIPYHIDVLSKLGFLYYKFMNHVAIKYSDIILTNSHSTKKDVDYYFKRKDVIVLYHSINETKLMKYNDNIIKKLNIKHGNYYLFVSSLKPHKNYLRVIEAFKKLNKNKNFMLVLVGKADRKLDFESSNIVFTDYISDEELNSLYKHAISLVFPSLIEGFGVPILEAQYHGCPVITSNLSSMPEIAGKKGALFVNPYKVENIKNAMQEILLNDKLKKETVINGKDNLRRFSWTKYTKQLVTIFKELE